MSKRGKLRKFRQDEEPSLYWCAWRWGLQQAYLCSRSESFQRRWLFHLQGLEYGKDETDWRRVRLFRLAVNRRTAHVVHPQQQGLEYGKDETVGGGYVCFVSLSTEGLHVVHPQQQELIDWFTTGVSWACTHLYYIYIDALRTVYFSTRMP